MGLVLVVAQGDDFLLSGSQSFDRLPKSNVLQPRLVGRVTGGVRELVDDVEGIPVIGKDGLVEGYGFHNSLHGGNHLLTGRTDTGGDLIGSRISVQLCRKLVPRLEGFVGHIPYRAADPHRGGVTQVPPHLPHDHGNGVGGEHDLFINVEVIHRLDQTNAPHLKEIVGVLFSPRKALHDGQNEAQIPRDHVLSGDLISLPYPFHKSLLLFLGEDLQLGGVDSAEDNFAVIHGNSPILLRWDEY